MLNRYGPWATMIDLGGSPQLSTFWRRRLTMLAPVSRTRFALSRRNLFWLGAATVLLMALPMIRFAAAGEKDASAAKGGDVAAKDGIVAKPEENERVPTVSGSFTVTRAGEPASNFLRLPTCIYGPLQTARTREQLKITPAQEEELAAISRTFLKRQEELRKKLFAELEHLSPEDRAAKQKEFQSQFGGLATSDTASKHIEAILTKEQLTTVRSFTIGAYGLARLMFDRQLREKVGVSNRQRNELEPLMKDQQRLQAVELPISMDAIDRKMLAVVTPEQWAKLERDTVANRDIVPEQEYPSAELSVLLSLGGSGELGVTAEQAARVREVFEEAQMRISGEGGSWTLSAVTEPDAKPDGKLAKWLKKDHAAVERILNKKQLAALDKLVLRYNFRQGLDMSLLAGTCSLAGRTGLLRQIDFSAAQWKEICRLYDEKEAMMYRSFRTVGDGVLKILSPEQQDKFVAEWARVIATPPAESMPTKDGKKGGLTKAGKGFLIIQGSDATATKTPKGPPRILPPRIDGWGPEHEGLRTRLLPAQKEYAVGWPAKFRLEMKNFGRIDRKYDSQGVDVNGMIRITGRDGKPVRYVGGSFQTAGHSRSIAPGETVVLFDEHDLANQYSFVRAGSYTLQFRGTNVKWDAESDIPPSAEVAIEMRPGTPPVFMQVSARLGKTLPEKWSLSLNGRVYEVKDGRVSPPGWESGSGTFISLIPPSGSKRNPLSVPIWVTERRLAWTGTRPFLVGTEWTEKDVTPSEGAVYLGKGADGHIYWKAPKEAESQWPDIRTKVKAALQIKP
jgi:hypothetical protein